MPASDQRPDAAAVANETARLIEALRPTERDILNLGRQLIARHAELGLEPVVSSEEIVEAFFRCRLTDHLAQRFDLAASVLPERINASHTAVRRVCAAEPCHEHVAIPDSAWTTGWTAMQARHPSVNVKVPGRRSAKHADLYVIAGAHVVSLEFKYVPGKVLRDPPACIEQMRRHAEHHDRALFVVYSRSGVMPDFSQVRAGLLENAQLVHVAGPPIAPVDHRP